MKPGGEVRALAALQQATYPAELVEVLIAYGSAPSAQRNRAALKAQGEIVFFIDDDSRVAPDFIERTLMHFHDPKVAAVGGPSLTPASDTSLQKAFGAAFASPFGGGGVRNRYRKVGVARSTDDCELILCNLSFRRKIFLEEGGLDERLYPNEENELMDRLLKEGFSLVHDPELAVFRSQRGSYRAFVRQMMGYGRGRGEQTVITRSVKLASLAPSLFLLYLVLFPICPSPLSFLPPIAYLVAALAASVVAGVEARDFGLALRLLVLFPTLHLMYGFGVFRGLLFPRFKERGTTEPKVEIRTVKELGKQ